MLCMLWTKECEPSSRIIFLLAAPMKRKVLAVICWGNSVSYNAIQVKHTDSEAESAFQKAFCQLTAYFVIQEGGTFSWSKTQDFKSDE